MKIFTVHRRQLWSRENHFVFFVAQNRSLFFAFGLFKIEMAARRPIPSRTKLPSIAKKQTPKRDDDAIDQEFKYYWWEKDGKEFKLILIIKSAALWFETLSPTCRATLTIAPSSQSGFTCLSIHWHLLKAPHSGPSAIATCSWFARL